MGAYVGNIPLFSKIRSIWTNSICFLIHQMVPDVLCLRFTLFMKNSTIALISISLVSVHNVLLI
jgi:hypothetical protein